MHAFLPISSCGSKDFEAVKRGEGREEREEREQIEKIEEICECTFVCAVVCSSACLCYLVGEQLCRHRKNEQTSEQGCYEGL
jgi:hypothetical protein